MRNDNRDAVRGPRRGSGHRHDGRGPFNHEEESLRHGPEGRGRGHGPGRDDSGFEGGRGRHGGPGPFGPGGPGGRRGGRGRAQRGDVRTAVLLLLADEPMHGYQLMQAIGDRTGGAWRPSPRAVYPTISQLEDEGLVTTEAEGGRRLVTLTDEGRTYLTERSERLGDPFADYSAGTNGPDLRGPISELHVAARQVAVGGDPAQVEAAARVLKEARRALYLILAGEPESEEAQA